LIGTGIIQLAYSVLFYPYFKKLTNYTANVPSKILQLQKILQSNKDTAIKQRYYNRTKRQKANKNTIIKHTKSNKDNEIKDIKSNKDNAVKSMYYNQTKVL
jgi:hypothetical protein